VSLQAALALVPGGFLLGALALPVGDAPCLEPHAPRA